MVYNGLTAGQHLPGLVRPRCKLRAANAFCESHNFCFSWPLEPHGDALRHRNVGRCPALWLQRGRLCHAIAGGSTMLGLQLGPLGSELIRTNLG